MKRFLKKWLLISLYILYTLLLLVSLPALVWAVFSFTALSPNPYDWWAIARFLGGLVAVGWGVVVGFALNEVALGEMKAQYNRLMENSNES